MLIHSFIILIYSLLFFFSSVLKARVYIRGSDKNFNEDRSVLEFIRIHWE